MRSEVLLRNPRKTGTAASESRTTPQNGCALGAPRKGQRVPLPVSGHASVPFPLLRWLAVSVFVISSTLNYIDRALLSTLAPLLMAEMHLTQVRFGFLISAFSIAYAASSLFAGWFLDRVGVTSGICGAVAWWSAAAISTAFTRNLAGLACARAALGIGESAGVPAAGKLNGLYLEPSERALGAALNQVGLSLGLALAPLSIGIAQAYGWRIPFIFTGALGFLWIPLWIALSRAIRPKYADQEFEVHSSSSWAILLDRRLAVLVFANVLWMGSYSLWSNWTTLYLVKVHGLTLVQTARFVWIPPLVSNIGGFFGGWLSLKWIEHGNHPVAARRRAIWVSAAGSLFTLLLPLAPDARWATAIISVSFFFALAGSVNIYALPIDIFGPARSGLAIAALTCAFGILQTVISPVVGYLGDHRLYQQVVWLVTLPLLAGGLVLQLLKLTPEEYQNASNRAAS
ncbi:MAG: MFS transporter [Acidobacteriaceae bacterium]|nr:MFS transporter [Acidobacteriaceae bacterium]